MALHFYGEKILSLRSMLKRFIRSDYQTVSPGANKSYQYVSSIIPPNPSSVGSTGTQYINNSVYSHIQQAFAFMRGGVKKRINIITDGVFNNSPIFVNLNAQGALASQSLTATTVFTQFPNLNGGETFVPSTNGGIEFELPFYSNNYFYFASAASYAAPTSCPLFDSYSNTVNYTANFFIAGTPTQVALIEQSSLADDFQFSYWLGAVPYASH